MKIIYYNIHYYSESFFAFILFILLCLSLFTLFYLMTEKFDNENKNNNSLKILLLLNFGFCLLLFINFIFIGNLTKKPFLSIKYTNDNINQETIKNKKEIVNDIINGNVTFGHNHDLKYFTYKFEITEEEANELKSAKEKFDKKNKEIEQDNENKAKTGNVKFIN